MSLARRTIAVTVVAVALFGCPKPPPSAEQPIAANGADDEDGEPDEPIEPIEPVIAEPEPEPEPPYVLPADYLQFAGACAAGDRITIAFGGDLLLHHELQEQAYASEHGAAALWPDLADLLAEPDLTYLNLEGPLAPGLDRDFLEVRDPGKKFDRINYSSYPRFNYHPSIAADLVAAGIDVVSTANNHALDRGPLGVDRTIAGLRKAKLAFFGTRAQGSAAKTHTITETNGVKIGWVACTTMTNRIPDDHEQVQRCRDGAAVAKLIAQLRATGRYADKPAQVDAVIVTPHWGAEYSHVSGPKELALAQRFIDAGAIAVIGSHPHVVQPWQKLIAADGREGLVFYSLGNFASHQPELSRRSSLLLYITLVRDADGLVQIAGTRHLPITVRQAGDEFFVESIDRAGGPADARALLVALLGASNLVMPDEAKLGDPHCDPTWRPHAIPQWAVLSEPFVVPGTEAPADVDVGP